MANFEKNAEFIERIIEDFELNPDPSFSEADTRAKIIDEILHNCLGWPEKGPFIKREEHVHRGYIDYTLRAKGTFLIIEAKRSGKTFYLPDTFSHKSNLSVKNLIFKQPDIKIIYDQVTRYAHESGIMYCVITNGTQWLVFPGVRIDNIHIRNSKVIVFNGLKNIRDNFVEFWGLLSYESVSKGNLGRQIMPLLKQIEDSFTFGTDDRIYVPYDRNPLSSALVETLNRYFGDLHGDPQKTKMLKECFVYDMPISQTMGELGLTSGDEKPSKTINTKGPILHFYTLPNVSEKLNTLMDSFLSNGKELFLQILLGRVGIGKTTFLHYFLDTFKRKLVKENFTLFLDFRDANEHTDLDAFFNDNLWELCKGHEIFRELMSRSNLINIYSDEIEILTISALSQLERDKPDEYAAEISRFLAKQLENKQEFLKKFVSWINSHTKIRFFLIFDNVDQLPAEMQQKVIRYAYSKGSEFKAFLMISMWEETYYYAKRTGQVLSTIRTVPMQITRQSITSVLTKRLDYFIKQIKAGEEKLNLLDSSFCDRETFCKFLELTIQSLLIDNRKARMFLEAVALGNIRRALEIFHSFLTAGSFDTARIISLMKKHEKYVIPIYQFIRTIMLGSKKFYSERTSDILNVYSVGDIERPSHFTNLRMLQWFYERRHESTPFGTGFMHLRKALDYFRNIGVSKKDFSGTLIKLIEGALLEDDIRSTSISKNSQAIRITPTGRYYLTYLYKQFAYVDLVLEDTPLFSKEIYTFIGPDIDSNKIKSKIRRCDYFISYLEDQENEELTTLNKLHDQYKWTLKFTDGIRTSFESVKKFINSKRKRKGSHLK